MWNEEFTFKLKNPKLTFVQFTLVNKNNFVGHYMIALQAMNKGRSDDEGFIWNTLDPFLLTLLTLCCQVTGTSHCWVTI